MKRETWIKIIVVAVLAVALLGGWFVLRERIVGLFSGPDRAAERVESDIEAISDGTRRGGESLGRLERSLGDIRDSTESIEGGIERAESRTSELEARSAELERSLRSIRDAESRGRAAVELGRAANRRLEDLIRRLQAEGGPGGPAQEDLADGGDR